MRQIYSRRIGYLLLVVFICALVIFLSAQALFVFLAKQQLKKVFAQSEISLKTRFEKGLVFCLEIDSLKRQPLILKNIFFRINLFRANGEFALAQVKYDKIKIDGVKGKFRIRGRNLFLEALSAEAWGGEIQGSSSISLRKKIGYTLDLKLSNLNLEALVKDFDLENKFLASGLVSGSVKLAGSDNNLQGLEGDLFSLGPGGTFDIRDTSMLQDMARSNAHSQDILVENFKDYHYNKGIIKFCLDKGNLIFDFALEGEKGKRNLSVVVHNVSKRGGRR